MAHPFGAPNWRLTVPALLCALVSGLLFTRVIDLGAIPVAWTIAFNANIAVALAILAAGVVQFLMKARKSWQELRSKNTIISLLVLALLIAFFLSPILNLGIFSYKIEALEPGICPGLLSAYALVWLAFRGSHIAVGLLIVLFLWWSISIKDFDLLDMFRQLFTSDNGGRLLRALMLPNWGYFKNVIDPMIVTVQTAVRRGRERIQTGS